jgi:hypothetical protein
MAARAAWVLRGTSATGRRQALYETSVSDVTSGNQGNIPHSNILFAIGAATRSINAARI